MLVTGYWFGSGLQFCGSLMSCAMFSFVGGELCTHGLWDVVDCHELWCECGGAWVFEIGY